MQESVSIMRRLVAFLALAFIAQIARADVVRILDDPRDAVQARADIIRGATQEIDALYFLARNDRITLGALALLRDARRRGVPRVRLIVDANFQHIPKAVLAHLSEEGVEIRVYHPMTLRHPMWVFRRMHEKVIVVDSRFYITGGRNLAEAYFGLAKRNFVDRDVYVEGASASDAEAHLQNLWTSRHVADLHVRVSDIEKRVAATTLDDARNDLLADDARRNWSEGRRDAGPVRFLHDPIASDGPRVGARLAEILDAATTSITIESPYLVPSRNMLDLLEKKVADGVRVEIVTNSFRSSDGVLPYVGYLKYRRRVARDGIQVREFKGPDTLHAKSIVVDGHIAIVGSYNLDQRSENLNTEVMAVIDDARVARELLDSIDVHRRNSWMVDGTGSLPRFRRSLRSWLARMVLPIVEPQL